VTKQFQADNGLAPSGVVGEATLLAMTKKLRSYKADLDSAKIALAQKTSDLVNANNLIIIYKNKITNAVNQLQL